MKHLVLMILFCLAAPALADDLSAPGALLAARRDITVTRTDGSSFTATIHYPGTSATVGAPLNTAAGPYPIIAFGHGYIAPVSLYQSTGAHLATWGFITLCPQTQGGMIMNHTAFAADLVSSLDWIAAQATVPGSPWFGGADGSRRGAMGHSMGGGSAMLAAKSDPRIRCLLPWAAAETSPSAITAALSIECATRLIVGSQDAIITPSSTSAMYPNLAGSSQLVTIVGGFHCGFVDMSFAVCDSGSITREQQLVLVRRESTEFLLLHLKGDLSRWSECWDAPPGGSGITQDAARTADIDGDGFVNGVDLGILLSNFGTSGAGDIDANGSADGADLGTLLSAWTG
ncbi:MAG: alpha/beta hydrolase [Phycisphaerae bacterium]|nr:alpha/beta hydrolase [Phycisphaerae bacterium]